VNTPEFSTAQRQRKKVEVLFAELKNQIGLRRLRLRRIKFVREQFFLAAAEQNVKRLVRFLSRALRERISDPFGPESCVATARDPAKVDRDIGGVGN
jgi:Transposase DDE domain